MRIWPLLVCLLVPGVASADGYFGWGMSPGHRVEGDVARQLETDGEVGGRLMLGTRDGDTAFEASFFGTDLHPIGVTSGDALDSSTLSLGAGVKQFAAVSPRVDLYARAGLDYTWLVPYGDRASGGWEGLGLDYGAGVEAGTRHGGWGARVWIDLGQQRVRLHGKDETLGATFTSITFGVTVLRDR